MSLPSQHIGSRGRVVTTRRRRRRRSGLPRAVIVFGVMGLLVVSVWAIWPGSGAGSRSGGDLAEAHTEDAGERLAFLDERSQTEPDAEASTNDEPGGSMTSDRTRSEPPLVIDQGSRSLRAGGPGSGLGESVRQEADRTGQSREGGSRALGTPERPARDGRVGEGNAVSERVAPSVSARLQEVLTEARTLEESGELVPAREVLNRAMFSEWVTGAERGVLRGRMTRLNEEMVFSPRVHAGDPMTGWYEVRSGDTLARIVARESLGVGWRLLQRVNGLASPDRIRVGQSLKVVRGPFHAVVDKSEYRLDVYWGQLDDPSSWVYVQSFPVGLGEGDSTPLGRFVVRGDSRLKDPAWTNPRTGEHHDPGPGNPIGRYWIGMEGQGEYASLTGFGIHGTNEPASIGQQRSMGCIRLADEDIELLFTMLVERSSAIRVVP